MSQDPMATGRPSTRAGRTLLIVASALGMLALDRDADAAALRVADVVQRVSEQGPDAAVSRSQVEVAQAEVATARMVPNPGIGFTGGVSEPVFSTNLQLRLPILGQRGAHIRAAERGVEQAQLEALLLRWHLRHDARVAYYSVARAEEEVSITQQVEQLARRVADMARERFEVGTGSRLEQEQAALAHVRTLQDVSDRRAAARVARLLLGRLMGAAVAAADTLADRLDAVRELPLVETLLDQARSQHPELQALGAEQVAALARAESGRADRRPLFVLDLGLELLDGGTCLPNMGWRTCLAGPPLGGINFGLGPRAGLSFDLPVFNLNGGPIKKAEAEARLAEAKGRAALGRVESAVRAASENMTAALLRVRFFDAQYVPAADRVEQMAREGFAAGRTGLLPLLDAERAVLDARLGRTAARYAAQVAWADLEEASGVPLSIP